MQDDRQTIKRDYSTFEGPTDAEEALARLKQQQRQYGGVATKRVIHKTWVNGGSRGSRGKRSSGVYS